jgi:hypothetical protein
MSTLRVNQINLNDAANAYIVQSNTYNVSVYVNGSEMLQLLTNNSIIVPSTATFVSSNVSISALTAAFGATNSAFGKANTSVQNNATTLITAGYTVQPYNAGANISSYGTWTPDPANGNYQFATSNGAVTIAVPASNCAIDIILTNGVAAGSITFSGYTVQSGGTGDTYATTNANKYLLMIRRINSISTYIWKALQ